MASDIVPSSAGWATSQMKPDTDEEGNSLWSKNIADNTGYLFKRPETIFTLPSLAGTIVGGLNGSWVEGTFMNRAGINTGTAFSFLWNKINAQRSLVTYQMWAWTEGGLDGSIHFHTHGNFIKQI